MNRLPTKQIYLLFIIIVGIIALSVYSTYALFTFESSTSDIVSIHTPKSLQISENVYEYQQLVVEPNTVTTTDIDINNPFDYEVCYSIWYKVIGDTDVESKVQIFEKSDEALTASGVLPSLETIRVSIVIINDNDTDVKINIGTIGAQRDATSCSLNLTDDKQVISSSYKNIDKLTTKLIEENQTAKELNENYLTYKDITKTITFKDTDKLYVSEKFNYSNETFTLTNEEELTLQELIDKKYLETKDIYFCQGNSTKCSILYKITEVEKEEIETENEEEKIINYHITKYDKLIGYSKGTNGLRKVNNNDYIFYGDNPNNFIYYNCQNNDDLTTCELWRIVGFFYDEETNKYNTKIVRNSSIGKYQFDYKMINNENKSTNEWNSSSLNEYLNKEYKLINNYDNYLEEYRQKIERINNLETDVKNIKVNNQYINSKITLLNLSDYLYTSSCDKVKISEYSGDCIKNNWLNNIEIPKEWTMTAKEIEKVTEETQVEPEEVTEGEMVAEQEPIINYIYSIGENIEETNVNTSLDVRPVVFLKSRMLLLEGNGTLETPYIVK